MCIRVDSGGENIYLENCHRNTLDLSLAEFFPGENYPLYGNIYFGPYVIL